MRTSLVVSATNTDLKEHFKELIKPQSVLILVRRETVKDKSDFIKSLYSID